MVLQMRPARLRPRVQSLQMRSITTILLGNVAFAINATKGTINHCIIYYIFLFARDFCLTKFIFFLKTFVKFPHVVRSAFFLTYWSGSFVTVKFICSIVLKHFCPYPNVYNLIKKSSQRGGIRQFHFKHE